MNLIKLKLINIVFKFNKMIYINKNRGYTNDKNLLKHSKELDAMEKNCKDKGITLIALVVTTLFSYDEFIKSSNNKGFLLQTI